MRLKALYRLYKESILRNINRGIQFVVDVVYDRINNNIADIIGFILNLFSILFAQIIKIRYFLYDKQLLKNNPLGCLVIVVGNITVGGTVDGRDVATDGSKLDGIEAGANVGPSLAVAIALG